MTAPGFTPESVVKAAPERLVSTILFLGLVLIAGYGFFLVVGPFLAGLAWASVLAIAVQPLFRRFRKRLTAALSALLTTLIVAVTLIVPAAFLIVGLAAQCIGISGSLSSIDPARRVQLIHSLQEFWGTLQTRIPSLRSVDPVASLQANLVNISKQMASAVGLLAQNVLSFIVLGLFILLALFFLLRDGPALVAYLRRLSPLNLEMTDRLFEEIRILTESSVTATLLIAITQGTLGGGATALLGLPAPLVWGVAFGFCSFIPVFGTALAWIPAVVWLFATGQHGKAVVMLLVSILIVGQADNVLRPALVAGRSRLNFELSMLSVLGGVAAFGMLGLVLGPVVVSVLTALLDLYADTKPAAPDRVKPGIP